MRILLGGCLLILLVFAPGPHVSAGDEAEAPKITPHGPLVVAPTRPRPAAHYRHVEELVSRLAKLDEWYDGIDPSSGGGIGFAPHDYEEEVPPDVGVAALRALVALGPEAIPALLAHLDDATPTGLDITHGGGFGGMWFASEIDANPACPTELPTIRAAFPSGWIDDPTNDDPFAQSPVDRRARHVVTIGDCCFVALGHITNRVYEAVGYRPTAIYQVVSPSLDPRVARAVRSQWVGKDPRVELARRLVADYHTTEDPDGWDWAGERQAGAAQRMAFYFPEASEALLVGEIDRIEATDELSSMVSAAEPQDLVRGLSRSDRPAIRAAMLRLALRTGSLKMLDLALPGVGPLTDSALYDRILALLRRAKTPGVGHFEALRLLREISRRWPDRLETVLAELLSGTPGQAEAVAAVIFTEEREILLPIRSWMPWLVRGREHVGWDLNPPDAIRKLRLCDLAAMQIARQREDIEFDAEGEVESRDARIAEMLEILTPEYWK